MRSGILIFIINSFKLYVNFLWFAISSCCDYYFINLDLLTVNETSYDPPPEDEDGINSAQSLALEATIINQHFSQQVLKKVHQVSVTIFK